MDRRRKGILSRTEFRRGWGMMVVMMWFMEIRSGRENLVWYIVVRKGFFDPVPRSE